MVLESYSQLSVNDLLPATFLDNVDQNGFEAKLRKDDSAHIEDDDGVLVEISECLKEEDWEWGIEDCYNQNKYNYWEHHPMKDEFH